MQEWLDQESGRRLARLHLAKEQQQEPEQPHCRELLVLPVVLEFGWKPALGPTGQLERSGFLVSPMGQLELGFGFAVG